MRMQGEIPTILEIHAIKIFNIAPWQLIMLILVDGMQKSIGILSFLVSFGFS